MSIRSALLRSLVGLVLVTPVVPAHSAPDQVSVRLGLVTFTGYAVLHKARPSRPAWVEGYSTDCKVAGVNPETHLPFLTTCQFEFTTSGAAVSTSCTGNWTHVSTLSYTDPVTFTSVVLNYDPTTTTVLEGDGSGVGVNAAHLGHVYYTIASLCTTSEDSAEGNLVGYATPL